MQAQQLLRYHPNRYYHSRNFFRPLYSRYRQMETRDGVLSLENFREINERFVFDHWNPELSKLPVESRPLDINPLTNEFSLFSHVARFTLCGRNIFHFSPMLTELLKITDADDVLWSSVKLPYSCFYLWFGVQPQWFLVHPHYHVDGAYISDLRWPGERMIEVMLTTQCQGVDYANPPNFILHRDVYYHFPFSFCTEKATVRETLYDTIETHDSFTEGFLPPPIHPEVQRLASEAGKKIIQPPVEESAQRKAVRENLLGLPVFREVLSLVVNCLCYLASPSREVVARYPESVASKKLLEAKTPAQLKRARQCLAREGYTRINFCGESLDREYGTLPTGRELSAHWRRGHWRNQAIGPRYAEHKLIWIRPTLVRKDKASDDIPGHVYEVQESEH